MYNLEVEGNHNYYVSESGVLVHNQYVDDVISTGGKGASGATTGGNWSGKTGELAKTASIDIPKGATVKVQTKTGYNQISYKWSDGTYKYESRWHTKTPGAPGGQGNTWVVERVTPGTPTGQKQITEILTGNGQWTPRYEWQKAIIAQQNGVATMDQKTLLESGHWKAP